MNRVATFLAGAVIGVVPFGCTAHYCANKKQQNIHNNLCNITSAVDAMDHIYTDTGERAAWVQQSMDLDDVHESIFLAHCTNGEYRGVN
jgi:hypothetical protein